MHFMIELTVPYDLIFFFQESTNYSLDKDGTLSLLVEMGY